MNSIMQTFKIAELISGVSSILKLKLWHLQKSEGHRNEGDNMDTIVPFSRSLNSFLTSV